MIDGYLVLGAKNKKDLFQAWGAIPDPDCCVPGDANCPAASLDETYGFQWCPGDNALLEYVGKEGYRDPACDFADAPFVLAGASAKSIRRLTLPARRRRRLRPRPTRQRAKLPRPESARRR